MDTAKWSSHTCIHIHTQLRKRSYLYGRRNGVHITFYGHIHTHFMDTYTLAYIYTHNLGSVRCVILRV